MNKTLNFIILSLVMLQGAMALTCVYNQNPEQKEQYLDCKLNNTYSSCECLINVYAPDGSLEQIFPRPYVVNKSVIQYFKNKGNKVIMSYTTDNMFYNENYTLNVICRCDGNTETMNYSVVPKPKVINRPSAFLVNLKEHTLDIIVGIFSLLIILIIVQILRG